MACSNLNLNKDDSYEFICCTHQCVSFATQARDAVLHGLTLLAIPILESNDKAMKSQPQKSALGGVPCNQQVSNRSSTLQDCHRKLSEQKIKSCTEVYPEHASPT